MNFCSSTIICRDISFALNQGLAAHLEMAIQTDTNRSVLESLIFILYQFHHLNYFLLKCLLTKLSLLLDILEVRCSLLFHRLESTIIRRSQNKTPISNLQAHACTRHAICNAGRHEIRIGRRLADSLQTTGIRHAGAGGQAFVSIY